MFTPCQTSLTQQVTSAENGATITWPTLTATDNSQQAVNIQQTPGQASGSFFVVGPPITITYIGADVFGNTATCTFTVTVTRG